MEENIKIKNIEVSAYTIPTETPESDGTLEWNSTTIVLVEISAGGKKGIGYTYSHHAAAILIKEKLADTIKDKNALDVGLCWNEMVKSIRNLGRPGISSCAIAAVDNALWDLKAKLLEVPLFKLLGQVRDGVEIYGSGGFTSYSIKQLNDQLSGWVDKGIKNVKMKIGREPDKDINRVAEARKSIGRKAELFVDANGAYNVKQALNNADKFAEQFVTWFEEPVSSDNLLGLNQIKNSINHQIEVAAGEYGYDINYFNQMLSAKAVDVLQADATRCAGITGFLKVSDLCEAYHIPFSAHTAPSIHLHPCCASKPLRNVEYFFDHIRIEKMFFDGFPEQKDGKIYPDLSRHGLGIELKKKDAEKFKI